MASSLRPTLYRSLFAIALLSFLTTAILPGMALGAPLVAITRPTQGALVAGSVWIDVAFRSDSDKPITRLELYVDEALAGQLELASPLLEGRQSFNWDFTYSASTVHKIGARAIDAAGNVGNASVTVQVQSAVADGPDRVPPVVRIYYPADGAKVSGQVEIKAEAQDNVGVELVYFYVDGRLHKMMMQAPPYTDLWDTTRVADGNHSLEVVALDAAENEARSAQVTVIVENHSMTLMGASDGDLPVGETPRTPATATLAPAASAPVIAAPPVAAPPTVALATPPVAPVLALPRVALAATKSLTLDPLVRGPQLTTLDLAPSAPATTRTSLPATVQSKATVAVATTKATKPVVTKPITKPVATTVREHSTLTPMTQTQSKPAETAVAMTPVTAVAPAAAVSTVALARPATDSAPVSAARMLARLPQPGEYSNLPAIRSTQPAPVASATVPLAVAKVRDIKIVFDGEVLTLRAAPETRRGLSVAPLREIFERTDGVLYWLPVEKQVHAVNKNVDMKLTIGDRKAQVNGEERLLEVAPFIKQGRTMVPLQFIAETLDVKITFDSQSGQILIASNQQ